GQDADFHRDAVELFRGQARESRVLRGALRGFLDRLDEREERLRVADAATQQATRMFVERDERPGLRFECLGDFNGSFRALDDVRLEGLTRDAEIGSLVVVETGKPMGIVTERDIVTKVAAPDKQPSRVLVRDIMTSPVVVVHPHEEVAEAAKLMSQRKIRRLPVVQEGK